MQKNFFSVLGRTKVIEDGYFLSGHTNLVKKSFITELNKFLSLAGAISYFGEEENNLINIVCTENRLEFSIKSPIQKKIKTAT